MDHDESRKLWGPDAAMYEITRFFKTGFIPAALRDVEGVETWVELHLRPLQKSMDITKEAMLWTHDGKAYPVCIEGTAHVSPTFESVQAGIWRPGDWLVMVSGIPYESLQAGDLLVQEKNARKRAARKRKSTTDCMPFL